MTAIELKSRVYQQIAHLDEAQLEKLYELLDQEFVTPTTKSSQATKKRPLGNMKDKIWMTDDWNSDEVNQEIAQLFNEGSVFPKE
ncbi:hypothetical protein [Tunicatimonas pelagia]|uniref:hypothetical protein n=1 Tax=Tunicatimonas pelagia TaxID=931531 RepID=UPI002666703D|nr:hypothetical protein [Tunicatimonas pelagia]WKN45051.1 hypothetical protein P0M28_08745 [Tunicatimonas pelagia]